MEKTIGIARERSSPTFHRESPENWFEARGSTRVPEAETTDKVPLFPDSYANYNHPDAGKAVIRVLEAAGVHVSILDDVTVTDCPAHSKGSLGRSRVCAETNADTLALRIEAGWSVVLIEPSDAVIFQSDCPDPLSSKDTERAAAETYNIMEYLDAKRLVGDPDHDTSADTDGETLTYHGHCYQKATWKNHHVVGVLRHAGCGVDPLDSGCCGMAGGFDYEVEHHSLSTAIGGIPVDQISGNRGNTVVAPGVPCRTQLESVSDTTDDLSHPIEGVSKVVAD